MKLLEIFYIDDFRWIPRSYRNQPKAELAGTGLESATLTATHTRQQWPNLHYYQTAPPKSRKSPFWHGLSLSRAPL
jgi:hypothetical protein